MAAAVKRSNNSVPKLIGSFKDSVCFVKYPIMSTGDAIISNPFADPSLHDDQHRFVQDSTLSVGRNASLTLGTDSLIVLGTVLLRRPLITILTRVDEGFTRKDPINCCGLIPSSKLLRYLTSLRS